MFKRFKDFIKNNLKEIKIPSVEDYDYAIKTVEDQTRKKFDLLKSQLNMPLWDIKTKIIIREYKGIVNKDIKELNKNLVKENGTKIPKDYILFLKNFNSISVLNSFSIYGHHDFTGPSIYFHSLKKYPLYIDANCLNIGSYNPDNSPIFINQKGNILVFSGTYIFDEKHEGLEEEAKEALIAYWDNIEDFIADETERYYKIFIEDPFAFPTKDMLPHNVTKEKFEQLVKDKKLNIKQFSLNMKEY